MHLVPIESIAILTVQTNNFILLLKEIEMFRYHPEQCLVGKSSVILNGGEHTEDQADQHWEKPDKDQDHKDDDDDHEEGDPPWNKKGFCGSFVYQDISRENPHFRGNRD